MASEFVQWPSPGRLFRPRGHALGRRLDHDQHAIFILIRSRLSDEAGDGLVNPAMDVHTRLVPTLPRRNDPGAAPRRAGGRPGRLFLTSALLCQNTRRPFPMSRNSAQIDLGVRSVLLALSESSPTGSGIPSPRDEGVAFIYGREMQASRLARAAPASTLGQGYSGGPCGLAGPISGSPVPNQPRCPECAWLWIKRDGFIN